MKIDLYVSLATAVGDEEDRAFCAATQGIEAGTAETVEQGSVHESPVGEQPMRPKDTA